MTRSHTKLPLTLNFYKNDPSKVSAKMLVKDHQLSLIVPQGKEMFMDDNIMVKILEPAISTINDLLDLSAQPLEEGRKTSLTKGLEKSEYTITYEFKYDIKEHTIYLLLKNLKDELRSAEPHPIMPDYISKECLKALNAESNKYFYAQKGKPKHSRLFEFEDLNNSDSEEDEEVAPKEVFTAAPTLYKPFSPPTKSKPISVKQLGSILMWGKKDSMSISSDILPPFSFMQKKTK